MDVTEVFIKHLTDAEDESREVGPADAQRRHQEQIAAILTVAEAVEETRAVLSEIRRSLDDLAHLMHR